MLLSGAKLRCYSLVLISGAKLCYSLVLIPGDNFRCAYVVDVQREKTNAVQGTPLWGHTLCRRPPADLIMVLIAGVTLWC